MEHFPHISDEAFDALITRAMDELPQEYIKGLENVVITYADWPDQRQRQSTRLHENGAVLLGLFEGIPRTERSSMAAFQMPDKITLFKNSILAVTNNPQEFYEQVKRTLWHEMAHYYGLSHADMDRLIENK